MLALVLIVVVPLALSHWLIQPLTAIASPFLSLAWWGWLVGFLGIWLLAGEQ